MSRMKSIYLSPSTQEGNIGYGNYGPEEKRMNQVADVVEKVLIEYGIEVYRNRPDWDLRGTVRDSNLRKPNLHFAIHSNVGGGRGAEIYAYFSGGEGEKAARIIYDEFEKISNIKGRGIRFNSIGNGTINALYGYNIMMEQKLIWFLLRRCLHQLVFFVLKIIALEHLALGLFLCPKLRISRCYGI